MPDPIAWTHSQTIVAAMTVASASMLQCRATEAAACRMHVGRMQRRLPVGLGARLGAPTMSLVWREAVQSAQILGQIASPGVRLVSRWPRKVRCSAAAAGGLSAAGERIGANQRELDVRLPCLTFLQQGRSVDDLQSLHKGVARRRRSTWGCYSAGGICSTSTSTCELCTAILGPRACLCTRKHGGVHLMHSPSWRQAPYRQSRLERRAYGPF